MILQSKTLFLPLHLQIVKHSLHHGQEEQRERVAIEPNTESLLIDKQFQGESRERPTDREYQREESDRHDSFSDSSLLPAFREKSRHRNSVEVKDEEG